jgi:hypothetical protein
LYSIQDEFVIGSFVVFVANTIVIAMLDLRPLTYVVAERKKVQQENHKRRGNEKYKRDGSEERSIANYRSASSALITHTHTHTHTQ